MFSVGLKVIPQCSKEHVNISDCPQGRGIRRIKAILIALDVGSDGIVLVAEFRYDTAAQVNDI